MRLSEFWCCHHGGISNDKINRVWRCMDCGGVVEFKKWNDPRGKCLEAGGKTCMFPNEWAEEEDNADRPE